MREYLNCEREKEIRVIDGGFCLPKCGSENWNLSGRESSLFSFKVEAIKNRIFIPHAHPIHLLYLFSLLFVYLSISAAGCAHNGSLFANGSFVPTVEPCLNCKCINANLICALRVCPEQPIPPPRGCVVVQKRDACCPYLTCSKYHTDYATDDKNRKVVTYDRKWYEQNIRNRIFSQNALLRRIDDGTPSDNDQPEPGSNQQSM